MKFSSVLIICGAFATLCLPSVRAQDEPPPIFAYVVERDVPDSIYNDYDVYVMNAETGEIVFSESAPQQACSPKLSPDHRWLLYNTQLIYTYSYLEASTDENINDIYLYDTETRESVNLTNTPEVERFRCLLG